MFNKIILIVFLVYVFMFSLWAIDMGATMKFVELSAQKVDPRIKVELESALLVGVEPRIVYHLGLVLAVGSFMAMLSFGVWELFQK